MTIQLEHGAWATVLLVGGPVLFLHGFRDLRIRRLIRDTPTARIRSMAMGLVELNGTVAPRSSLAGPFSGRPCAHWEVDISVPRDRGRGWQVVHRNRSGNPFYLRDETGVALVYPQGSDCRINHGVSEVTGGLGVPECYSRYMEEQGLRMRRLWQVGSMRFRERLLEEGQQVYLLGRAEPRAQSVAVSGDELQSTGTDGGPVAPAMRAERLAGLDHEVAAVVRRGERDPVFLISQQSEREIAFTLGWKATAELVAGPAMTMLGVGYWLYTMSRWQGIK